MDALATVERLEGLLSESTPPEAVKAVGSIRGFGRCYLRGQTWWIRYHHHGQEIRESVKSERLVDAERLLKAQWKQIGKGKFIGPKEPRWTPQIRP